MMALVRPKPSMARLTTSEPKCAQLPTENRRMMPICSAITAPATRPTDRYRKGVGLQLGVGLRRLGAAPSLAWR